METGPLKSFATWARSSLITEVTARLAAVLAQGSPERVERPAVVTALEKAIASVGGGAPGKAAVADRVAYTWFNRIVALRFMDANAYNTTGVVSPGPGADGQPEVLAAAKGGQIDTAVVSNAGTREVILGLLGGTRKSPDAQGEAYALLLSEYCRHWNKVMPFMFEREGDFTELLIPSNLLADGSVLNRTVAVLTKDVCKDVEVIGWLYQFYISERKEEVFAGFKKSQKAGADEIPAATQLFTPDWIVRYLVENSLGRLWMLNRPSSPLVDQMDYLIAPIDHEKDFLRISSPERLKVIDPACGSGHMLTYAFDLLYAIYEEEGYAPSEIPGLILANNLYGTEIDPRAGALAAFALTMKARGRQRTFFNTRVDPKVCVIQPISFTPAELDVLTAQSRRTETKEQEEFWNQFRHADVFGALIRPEPETVAELGRHLDQLRDSGDLLVDEVVTRATRVVEQAQYLAQQYDVAIANPPYMGSKNMDSLLSAFLKDNYKGLHSDLFAAFVGRMTSLVRHRGRLGLMTPNVWMYISSHAATRRHITAATALRSLVELPLGGFKGATVQICAFTAVSRMPAGRAHFVRLVDVGTDERKLQQALQHDVQVGESNGRVHVVNLPELASVPNGALAYALPAEALAAYSRGKALSTVAYGQPGLQTSDNSRFIRYWYEVSFDRIGEGFSDSESAKASGRRWFPYLKGGDYRKWYGNESSVVDWENNGRRIKMYVAESYPYLNGNVDYVVKDRGYYFRPMISYTKIGTGRFAARRADQGHLFDVAGSAIFPSEQDTPLVLGFLGSIVGEMFLRAQNPTLNVQSGDIDKLPYDPSKVAAISDSVREAVDELVALARSDWNSQELSRGFVADPLVAACPSGAHTKLPASVSSLRRAQQSAVDRSTLLERALDSSFVAAYGIGELEGTGLTPAPPSLRTQSTEEIAANLVSYAVGCMVGRYSLDQPGLILADQGATLQDYLAKVPTPTFMPDADNVLPIVGGDWFEDDIVARFRQFLRAAFGEEHFEENLHFVTESLGVKEIRDYFVKSFYKDHVQRYKKRPIYWLFSSPSGSLNALIYLHRYTPSTASTVLNEYLREYKSKLEASRQHHEKLAISGTGREQASALKEVDRIRKVLLELNDYEHNVLYPLATQQVPLDLDDGVKVNYPKLGSALKRIPGLEASDD